MQYLSKFERISAKYSVVDVRYVVCSKSSVLSPPQKCYNSFIIHFLLWYFWHCSWFIMTS